MAFEVVDEREQMRRREDVDVLAGPRGLRAARGRADEPLPHGVGADGCGQRARHGSDRSVERELADRRKAGDRVGRDRLHGDHHGEHDWQVELAAFLGQVGGREIHRHVAVGHAETDGVQRVAHALAAFGDRLVGQADDDERGLARRDAHLHLDRARLDADERERGDLAVHAPPRRPIARPSNARATLAEAATSRKNIRGTRGDGRRT